MRRILVAFVVAVLAMPVAARASASSGSLTEHDLPPGATYPSRHYITYRPADLAPTGHRALVVVLHGCTQRAMDMVKGTGWNRLADQHGFVVVYPEQSRGADGSAAGCWNAGQAPAFPRGEGELESVAQITRLVKDEYHVRRSRVFLVGLSGGGTMTSSMAATYPDLYWRIGIVAGCAYLCSDPTGDLAYNRMGDEARVVPAIVFNGTLDYLINPALGEMAVSQWVGTNDLADDGAHNGSVSPVPRVEHRYMDSLESPEPTGDACLHTFPRNPCPVAAAGVSPYPTTVRHYAASNGREAVQSWTIHGLSHNYSGGSFEGNFTDPYGPDITQAAWDFFASSR